VEWDGGQHANGARDLACQTVLTAPHEPRGLFARVSNRDRPVTPLAAPRSGRGTSLQAAPKALPPSHEGDSVCAQGSTLSAEACELGPALCDVEGASFLTLCCGRERFSPQSRAIPCPAV
jgi:hypothetical protein